LSEGGTRTPSTQTNPPVRVGFSRLRMVSTGWSGEAPHPPSKLEKKIYRLPYQPARTGKGRAEVGSLRRDLRFSCTDGNFRVESLEVKAVGRTFGDCGFFGWLWQASLVRQNGCGGKACGLADPHSLPTKPGEAKGHKWAALSPVQGPCVGPSWYGAALTWIRHSGRGGRQFPTAGEAKKPSPNGRRSLLFNDVTAGTVGIARAGKGGPRGRRCGLLLRQYNEAVEGPEMGGGRELPVGRQWENRKGAQRDALHRRCMGLLRQLEHSRRSRRGPETSGKFLETKAGDTLASEGAITAKSWAPKPGE